MNKKEELLEEEKEFLKNLDSRIGKLAATMERTKIDEYTSLFKRPWKFFFFNFIAGIFRGLGMAIGFTLIFALAGYVIVKILVSMVDLPIVGMYVAELVKFVNKYLQNGIIIK